MIDCCPGDDAELTLNVLHSHSHHVKIHPVFLPLLDLIRKKHWQGTVILPEMGNLSSALLKLPCPALPRKQAVPGGTGGWKVPVMGRAPHCLPQDLPVWILQAQTRKERDLLLSPCVIISL